MIFLFKKYQKLLLIFVFMIVLLIVLYFYQKPDGLLHIIFYNVGQGDGVLIKTPTGEAILIDGGPNEQIIYSLSEDFSIFKRKIDIGIVSHPHADHITGFIEVFRRFYFGSIYINDLEYQTPEVETLKEELQKNHKFSRKLTSGESIHVKDVSLEAVWPQPNYTCTDDINECSIVLRLDYQNFCAYFMGDVSHEVQGNIKDLKQCEIIKIAHQGAKNAVDENFIKKVKPKFGIVSVGKNNYGHPSSETLEILKLYNIKALRTDELGDIEIITDGQKYNIITK